MHINDQLGSRAEQIIAMITSSMENGDHKLQVCAIQVLGSLITTLSPKEVKKYFKFAIPVMKILHEMFFGTNGNIDHACAILDVVAEAVETDPKFFRANFSDLISLMSKIRNLKEIEGSVRDQALEIAVSMTQRYPEFVRNNTNLLSTIVEMIFLHMLDIPDECTEEWSNPPDGFDEKKMEDDSQKVVSFATDCIDRLCSSVGDKVMLKYLGDCVARLLETGEWKKVFASFMALSQVGEYMEDVDEIKPIVIKLIEHSSHPEPRVRYAVMHCLGQVSDDFAPKFQEFYHDKVLPIFLKAMDDSVPRVVAHACASATNFIENCQQPHIQPLFDAFYTKLYSIIDLASSFVKENALSALSALSVGAPELFTPYYDNTMETLLKILNQINAPAFKRLRGNAIECISIMTQEVGLEKFEKFAEIMVSSMINIQDHHLDKEEDPQRNFILLAWPRISNVLKGHFDQFIPRVVPSVLAVCKAVAEQSPEKAIESFNMGQEKEEDDKRDDYHTFVDDECTNALNTIASFMEDCPAAMAPFIEDVYKIVTPLMAYETNEDVRTTAAECLPAMVICIKGNPQFASKLAELAKEFMSRLWQSMDEENHAEVLIKQATSMQEVIETAGDILSPEELDAMYNKCMEHLKKSDDRKKDTDEQIDDDEDEIEVLEVHEQEKDLEDQLHCTIAEIFGKLFLTHKQKALPIFERLHHMFIATSLQDSQKDMIKKFGLFLICDSVDHLGTLIGEARLSEYYQHLKKYALYPHVFVRHAAIYGIGSMATVLQEKWLACFEDSIQTLNSAMSVPKGIEDEEVYKNTNENIVSAVGKIIKATWAHQPEGTRVLLINEWIKKLPIKLDKIEAVASHTFFIGLLESFQSVVLNKVENLEKSLNIIASIWKTKSSTPELDSRMSMILRAWNANPQIQQEMSKVSLTEKKQIFIKRALEETTN